MGSCQSQLAASEVIALKPSDVKKSNESLKTSKISNDNNLNASNDNVVYDSSDSETACSRSCASVPTECESRHVDGISDNGQIPRASSAVGLDTMIEDLKEEGALSIKLVHIEVPFGKPIEEVYDGVHDGPVLGSGISGTVRLCVHKKTGVKYAVKCLDLQLLQTEQSLQQLRDEIFTMCQLDHPNIVRLEEVYESHNEIYLVLELCLGGELFDRLDEQPDYHYTEQECARLVKQMLSPVRYIHSKGIIHRDLKLENFLFSSRDPHSELKIIDFGLSKHFEFGEVQNDVVGTPYSVAPEVIGGKYDERCDVWAIGVITYLLLSGDPPFGGCGGPEPLTTVRDNILRGSFEFEPEDIWANVSDQAKDFIRSLLVTDPRVRPSSRGAQHSSWLKEWAVKETKADSNLLNPNVVKALVAFKEYGDMRKLLCEVLSFTLLPDQIKDLRKEFEKLDKDGSGEITLKALKKVLMENAGAGSLGALTEGEVEDIFDAMRVRKTDTTIQWHEFIAAGLSQCKVDDRNLRLAFDRMDSDHKGYIIYDDIVDLMGGDKATEESIRKMYFDGLKYCNCKNAQITYGDFLLLMKGQTAQSREPSHPHPITVTVTTGNPFTDAAKKSVHRTSTKLYVVPEIRESDFSTKHETSPEFSSKPQSTLDAHDDKAAIVISNEKILPTTLVTCSSAPVIRRHSRSVEIEDEYETDESPSSRHHLIAPANIRRCVALPEHDHDDKKLEELIHDEKKSPLQVNRNLYRAHRQMRLAVLEASKLFEEEQARRVMREVQSESCIERVGAGLVMKHGQSQKLSTEEVRKILMERQIEQQSLLEKANKQAGRGNQRRKKTVSDMSAMLGSPSDDTINLRSSLHVSLIDQQQSLSILPLVGFS